MMKIKKFFVNRDVQMVFGMLLGSIIYSFGVVFITDLGSFYAGGITGISQIIEKVINLIFNKSYIGIKSILITMFNLPLFLVAWKGVSKKFAFVSLASVIIQVGLIALFEKVRDLGFNPFESLQDDILPLSILGGLILGVGEGIALKCGASTGGMDVVSQYVSLNYKKSFSKVSFSIDLTIILCAGILGYTTSHTLDMAVYTIIRMIITILVLDKIYTIYKYAEVTIITDDNDLMREALLKNFNHSMTIYDGTGGFTNDKKVTIKTIVWSFEIEQYKEIAKQVNPKCFIYAIKVKSVDGNFKTNVIA